MNAVAKELLDKTRQLSAEVTRPIPGSKKIHVEGSRPDLRVPMREIALSNTPRTVGFEKNAPLAVYDTSGPYTDPEADIDLARGLAALRARWIAERGDTEVLGGLSSAFGRRSVAAGMPLLLFAVVTLLMLQLRSFSRTAMVLLTAPLGLIGVTWFLLIPQVPFGFVAMLGTIALSGMIMRNAVILIDQIERDIAEGMAPFAAVVEATVRRFRPIVLTALTAVLAMIPLSRSVFFGPMAVAIMGGLIVATALTLLFLPALYAAWFRIKAPPRMR
jgi:multidrug efflux pump